MNLLTRNETARWLTERDDYCILTHSRPDGDTLGTAVALCLGLRKLGKQAFVLENPETPCRYSSLAQGLTVSAPLPGSTLVCVDVAAPRMLPSSFRSWENSIALRIDHHASASSFTEAELVDKTAAACGEILYDVLMELGVALDKAIATALYIAVSTDTGCFRFANTTEHTFLVAAACTAAGADIYGLNQILFETLSLPRLRIQGWITENTRLQNEGRLAVCAIPRSVEDSLGVTEDDMDNISSFLRTIAGVEMAALLRENRDGSIKLSLRAIPGYDAGAICARFGGGGHAGAAGATLYTPLADAAAAVENAMLEAQNRSREL